MTAVAFEPTLLLIAASSQRRAPLGLSVVGACGRGSTDALAHGFLQKFMLPLWGWNPLQLSAWRPEPTPEANRLGLIERAALATPREVLINGFVGIALRECGYQLMWEGAGSSRRPKGLELNSTAVSHSAKLSWQPSAKSQEAVLHALLCCNVGDSVGAQTHVLTE